MTEKLQTIERSNLVPDTKESLWFADAITEIQKEAPLSGEEAALVLYDRSMAKLRALNEENSSSFPILNEKREKKVERTIELSLVISNVLSKEGMEDLLKLANSNKFKPISMKIEQGDIIREKEIYRDLTGDKELTELEAKELATCKKIIDVLLARIFSNDDTQSLNNIFELCDSNPELAADVGKLTQAAELIYLHKQHLEKISFQDTVRTNLLDQSLDRAEEKIIKPAIYVKELLEKAALGGEASANFAGFHKKIRDLEQKASRQRSGVSTRGQTIN